MSSSSAPVPVTAPLSPWAHGLRLWLATALALFASFWFELASPVSAALTVAILAQPRRGQALSRALYRFAGTALGGGVAILLVALFGQDRVLLLCAFTAWLGFCVFVAAYLPGDRAYGAVLSGYTVAMIVVAGIDAPQNVFLVTVERVAAISTGIVAVTVVNIGFGSPVVWTGLQAKLSAAADVSYALVRHLLAGGTPDPAAVAGAIAALVGLRDEANVIAGETVAGRNRAAGARSAIAALSAMIAASRALARSNSGDAASIRALENAVAPPEWHLASPPQSPKEACLHQHRADLATADWLVQDGLHALRTGARPQRDVPLPVHRDLPVALRDAIRIMLAFAISAILFVELGWPAMGVALSLVATLCALSATNPNPAAFAKGALISLPMAIVGAGVIRFVVLDGSQGFLALILAMAPVMFVAAHLSLRPKTAGIGILLNIFMPTLLSPTNPQSYDFQAFLNTAVLAGSSVVVLFLTSRLVLPVTPLQRLRWVFRSARQSLADVALGRVAVRGAQRAISDDQISQVAGRLKAGLRLPSAGLGNILAVADISTAVSAANLALQAGDRRDVLLQARRALLRADAVALEATAWRLLGLMRPGHPPEPWSVRAVAELSTAASVLAAHRGSPDADNEHGVEAVLEQIRVRSSLPFRVGRYALTAVILVVAALGSAVIWDTYVTYPWTRDGQVRVQVVRIAPRVSGEITAVHVLDNQLVHKGDLLYTVDRFDYAVALASATAEADSREADLEDKEGRNERRRALSTLSTSAEEKQQFDAAFKMATAALADSRAKRAQAQVNLNRTEVRSPVNGYITNLLLRPGDYATAGSVNIAVIDTDSYWVDGYFEETKLARIEVGDPATVRLMGYAKPLHGVVESVTRGISSPQAASNIQGLPTIDPIYTWVRLAQRVPIRIRIMDVPAGVPLVAGMTCTVSVVEPADRAQGWLHDIRRRVWRVQHAGVGNAA